MITTAGLSQIKMMRDYGFTRRSVFCSTTLPFAWRTVVFLYEAEPVLSTVVLDETWSWLGSTLTPAEQPTNAPERARKEPRTMADKVRFIEASTELSPAPRKGASSVFTTLGR